MWLLAILVFAALGALCAATEHALAEASRAKLDDMIEEPQRQQLDRLLEKDQPLALSATIYRAVFETAAVVTLVFHPGLAGRSPYAAFAWAAALVLVACELLPRVAAARAPETTLIHILPAFHALARPVSPVAAALLALTRLTRKGNGQANEAEDEAAEDILSAVTEGEKEGSIAGEQADMIENIIELRDADVAEIMTPRPDMTSVNINDPLEKTIQTALESGRSRLPVFRETRDDIVGVLYVRDLIAAVAPGAGRRESLATQALMRPPHFVPETMRISDLLRHFQDRETTLAIVVDEYGGTAGLVTIRDIVDMIVGEVRDGDEPQREPVVTVLDGHAVEADARTPVRRLNEDFGAGIPESDEYDTVAGYLCYTLGRVPREEDRRVCGDTEIVVLRADERRVGTVKITVKNGIKKT